MEQKQVAVYASNIYGEIGRLSVEGIIEAAARNHIKPIFFTSFTDNFSSEHYERFRDYDLGDFVVYFLADLRKYAGLLCLDSFMPLIYQEPIDRLERRAACPVVVIGTVKDPFYSVVDDQDEAMRTIVEHVITKHNCRDLVHVAGYREMDFTWERLRIFRETLEAHGLPAGDDHVYFGNLAPTCGEPIIQQMIADRLERGEKPMPDAVICANDYSAMGIVDAIRRHGYAVPDDVIVTGYDNIQKGKDFKPALTTAAQPFAELSRVGVDVLARLLRGEQPKKTTLVPDELVVRQSCGCTPDFEYDFDAFQKESAAVEDMLESTVQSSTNMMLGASMDNSEEGVFQEIETSCLNGTSFRTAVLCLMRGWDQQRRIDDPDTMLRQRFDVVCGVLDGESVKREPIPAGELLPPYMASDPNPYFIYPIHHLRHFMGYMIVTPDLTHSSQIHVKSWLLAVGTLLENWRVRHRLSETAQELEHLYQTDVLTGLYNRRGYTLNFGDYYLDSRRSGLSTAVFVIDMNNMKSVNDTYGHEEGDRCLCVIADCMRACAAEKEICARTGGDEFVVLAKNYTPEKAEDFARRLRETLAERNRRDGKPYCLTISIGYTLDIPQTEETLTMQEIGERYLREADMAMYRDKRQTATRDA